MERHGILISTIKAAIAIPEHHPLVLIVARKNLVTNLAFERNFNNTEVKEQRKDFESSPEAG